MVGMSNTNEITFNAFIYQFSEIDACYIEFPDQVFENVNSKPIKVKVAIDGVNHIATLIQLENGNYSIIVVKSILNKINKKAGDTVCVFLQIMVEDKRTGVPADVKKALNKNKDILELFKKLPPSHKHEYLEWILNAKRPLTRKKRIQGMIELLEKKLG